MCMETEDELGSFLTDVATRQRLGYGRDLNVAKLFQHVDMLEGDGMFPHERVHSRAEEEGPGLIPCTYDTGLQTET